MTQIEGQPEKLTPAEARCLAAVKSAMRRMRPIPPSVQDVANEMGVTKKTASVTLQQLQKKGKVTRDGRKSRTLRLVQRAS